MNYRIDAEGWIISTITNERVRLASSEEARGKVAIKLSDESIKRHAPLLWKIHARVRGVVAIGGGS